MATGMNGAHTILKHSTLSQSHKAGNKAELSRLCRRCQWFKTTNGQL